MGNVWKRRGEDKTMTDKVGGAKGSKARLV